MITATRAGMYAVGVLWGFRTKEELLANGAKVMLSQPKELFSQVSLQYAR
jgi:phosphoglycolate phosphatase